jgi:hypothetical protein
MRPFLFKSKSRAVEAVEIKNTNLFCADNTWMVALSKNEDWCSKTSRTYTQVLFESLLCLIKIFNFDDDKKIWGYVGTNYKTFRVEFCNSVQCHIFLTI